MKITSVSAFVMGVEGSGHSSPRRNWVFVRVDTDADIYGTGEATTEYHELAVAAMVEQHFGPMLRGQDPLRINSAWQQMRRCVWWRDGVVAASAASGIDQALWDIAGKACGQPVHVLLGGAVRSSVSLYARGDLGLQSAAAELSSAEEEGYQAFKLGPGAPVDTWNETQQVKAAVSLMHEMHAARRPNTNLMMDCGGLFSRKAAGALIGELSVLEPLFIEEPVNGDNAQDLVELRRAFPAVRLAAGERKTTRWQFREWLEAGAVDILQPDICHCGGISELMRIAAAAETYGLLLAPHNPYGPVALAANVHACAAMPNFLILEHCRHRPWSDEAAPRRVEVANGAAQLPGTPGLGVDLDWEYVRRHPRRPLQPRTRRDGAGGMPLM